MKTSQAAEALGMSAAQLLQIIHRYEIQVPKDVDRYVWSEAHLEEVRAALRRAEERRREEAGHRGLTAREAAGRLGIAYEELLSLVHELEIAVPRLGGPTRPYAFDEASLDLVRQALKREPEPPPLPRGLTTKEAAIALGVSYEILIQRMKPLREELDLQKDGAYLLWHPEAVARMREVLERRQMQQAIGEAEDYGQAVRSVELLAGALRKLADDVRKLHGLLARRPAETAFLNTLPARTCALAAPVPVLLIAVAEKGFQASLAELSLVTEGRTRQEALRLLRQRLWHRYREVRASPRSAPAEWTVLQQLIVPRESAQRR
jgi:hypothetical protein